MNYIDRLCKHFALAYRCSYFGNQMVDYWLVLRTAHSGLDLHLICHEVLPLGKKEMVNVAKANRG